MAPQLKLALEILLGLVAAAAAWKFLRPLARGLYNLRRGQADWDRVIDQDLEPLLDRLDRGEAVTPDEVRALAVHWPMRFRLYHALKFVNRLDLFPPEFLDIGMQALAQMSYWLMHPNELGAPPGNIQAVNIFDVEVKGRTGSFVVLRFLSPPDYHDQRGWMMGVAGPYFPDTEPYSCGCFSDFETEGTRTHEQLIGWYLERMPEAVLEQKGGRIRPVL